MKIVNISNDVRRRVLEETNPGEIMLQTVEYVES